VLNHAQPHQLRPRPAPTTTLSAARRSRAAQECNAVTRRQASSRKVTKRKENEIKHLHPNLRRDGHRRCRASPRCAAALRCAFRPNNPTPVARSGFPPTAVSFIPPKNQKEKRVGAPPRPTTSIARYTPHWHRARDAPWLRIAARAVRVSYRGVCIAVYRCLSYWGHLLLRGDSESSQARRDGCPATLGWLASLQLIPDASLRSWLMVCFASCCFAVHRTSDYMI
jgi:hypothetical protein